MPVASRTNVTCPNCRNAYPAIVEMAIDAQQDPESKIKLLSGRLNIVRCPYCGASVTVAAPLVYHDSQKEMLITFVPMELGMSKDQQEKVTGDLIRELTSRLPPGWMKGYVFQPRSALTLQGLIEQVLQADGVTPQMMEEQRQRARLLEQFLSTSPEQLPALVQQHDAQIDGTFLQTMGLYAQRAAEDGQQEAAQQIMLVQQAILQLSTYGKQVLAEVAAQEQVVKAVEEDVRALGEQPTRQDFMKLVLGYASDDMRLQALVGLVRGAFDERFFQELTMITGQAPSEARPMMEALTERLQALIAMVDEEARAELDQAVATLQALIQSPDPDSFIRENVGLFDEAFMAVLSANLRSAEEKGDQQAQQALMAIYQRVVEAMQAEMPAEVRFINALISSPSPEAAEQLLRDTPDAQHPSLLQALDQIAGNMDERGNPQVAAHVRAVRAIAMRVIGG
jgi:hypothetical protein